AQHPYKTQILDFHSCKTQWATRSLYFEGQKRNQFCILHYRLNLELLTMLTYNHKKTRLRGLFPQNQSFN
ncbi:MAG: hypothetical protein PX640_02715, partial [Microcystis sp. M49629_WE12]|uniref:hypothetical protein n=1 Tax=Microcystis sp. M53602_WE12 TaxID=3030674 RepID=UPI0025865A0E